MILRMKTEKILRIKIDYSIMYKPHSIRLIKSVKKKCLLLVNTGIKKL